MTALHGELELVISFVLAFPMSDVGPDHHRNERKKQLLENSANDFGGHTGKDKAVGQVPLHTKIGQLVRGNDFLNSALPRAELLSVKP